jgi:hypothetical protein
VEPPRPFWRPPTAAIRDPALISLTKLAYLLPVAVFGCIKALPTRDDTGDRASAKALEIAEAKTRRRGSYRAAMTPTAMEPSLDISRWVAVPVGS